MPNLTVTESEVLEPEELRAVQTTLEKSGQSLEVLRFFDALIEMARGRDDFGFRYVKVFGDGRFIGLAMIGIRRGFDQSLMISPDRPVLQRISRAIDRLSLKRKTVLFCFAEMLTMNVRPAFVAVRAQDEALLRDTVARHLLARRDADLVVIFDHPSCQALYENAGLLALPYASTASICLDGVTEAASFLERHPRTRKKLRTLERVAVQIEHRSSGLTADELEQMTQCLHQSAHHSRTPTPFQSFYNDEILKGAWVHSLGAVHTLLRLDGRIVAFASNLRCGDDLGGIMGGIDRRFTRGLPIYERLIVAEIEMALERGVRRMHFGIANNETKIRLVNQFEPVFVYVGARRALDRFATLALYPFTTLFQVMRFEQRIRASKTKATL